MWKFLAKFSEKCRLRTELKEILIIAWSLVFHLAALVCFGVYNFISSIINHDWRKEFHEITASPHNRREVRNAYCICRFGIQGLFCFFAFPFIMIYVAVDKLFLKKNAKQKPAVQ